MSRRVELPGAFLRPIERVSEVVGLDSQRLVFGDGLFESGCPIGGLSFETRTGQIGRAHV